MTSNSARDFAVACRNLTLRVLGSLPGDRIDCNFCGQRFRRIGPNHSEGLSCPRCGSVARERVVYAAILDQFAPDSTSRRVDGNERLSGLRVLELSPRAHRVRRRLYGRTFKSYTSSDFDQSAHAGDIVLDLTDDVGIGQLLGTFDILIVCHVLEHIPDYRVAIRNTARLLSPNGKLFFQVPFLEPSYLEGTGDEYHGDNTLVYHRFGFDIIDDFAPSFSSITLYLATQAPHFTSPEVSRGKYEILPEVHADFHTIEFGPERVRREGLGSADLCEVLVLANETQYAPPE